MCAFRSRSRIPAVVWKHPANGALLARCAQPCIGLNRNRSVQDERLLELFKNEGQEILYIMDSRPKANAVANMLRGGGYEFTKVYKNIEIEFNDIENIHVMRNSLNIVHRVCQTTDSIDVELTEATNHPELVESKWFFHLRMVLISVQKTVELIHKKGFSVLVHCSDGWDRTAQTISTSELLLDPYYRTIEGFICLVEKEWLHFGHQFALRYGHEEGNMANYKESQRSPIFPQWVDILYQLSLIFPSSFEWNERFLLLLMNELYSCRYGTFLFNSHKQRRDARLFELSSSFWRFILDNKSKFTNPNYTLDLEKPVLLLSMENVELKLWKNYFFQFRQQITEIGNKLTLQLQKPSKHKKQQPSNDDPTSNRPHSSQFPSSSSSSNDSSLDDGPAARPRSQTTKSSHSRRSRRPSPAAPVLESSGSVPTISVTDTAPDNALPALLSPLSQVSVSATKKSELSSTVNLNPKSGSRRGSRRERKHTAPEPVKERVASSPPIIVSTEGSSSSNIHSTISSTNPTNTHSLREQQQELQNTPTPVPSPLLPNPTPLPQGNTNTPLEATAQELRNRNLFLSEKVDLSQPTKVLPLPVIPHKPPQSIHPRSRPHTTILAHSNYASVSPTDPQLPAPLVPPISLLPPPQLPLQRTPQQISPRSPQPISPRFHPPQQHSPRSHHPIISPRSSNQSLPALFEQQTIKQLRIPQAETPEAHVAIPALSSPKAVPHSPRKSINLCEAPPPLPARPVDPLPRVRKVHKVKSMEPMSAVNVIKTQESGIPAPPPPPIPDRPPEILTKRVKKRPISTMLTSHDTEFDAEYVEEVEVE